MYRPYYKAHGVVSCVKQKNACFTQRRKDYKDTTIEVGIAERLCFFVTVVSLCETKERRDCVSEVINTGRMKRYEIT